MPLSLRAPAGKLRDMGAPEFSLRGYSDLILSIKSMGYQMRGFAEAKPAERHLIVRHDVDFSLLAAAAMAEQERELGFSSTYFVLLRTEFYNVFSREGREALAQICECGHKVGLHFDAALYACDRAAMENMIAQECSILETILGAPVTTMSFHRPAPDRIGEADRLAGRLNAYGPRFVKEMGYCSDSRGEWRHGTPLETSALHEGRALQLLIHPFWWQSPVTPPQVRLRNFLAERERFLDRELARHCTIHTPRG